MIIKYTDGKTSTVDTVNVVDANVIELVGTTKTNKSGFYISRDEFTDDWDFTDYTTVYRVLENSVMYSRDGSVWVEPTRDIEVFIVWDDEDDREGARPSEVTVEVEGKTISLNDSNKWCKVYENIPVSHELDVQFYPIEDYSFVQTGTSAAYTHQCIPEPSMVERITDLEEAVCEISDIIAEL